MADETEVAARGSRSMRSGGRKGGKVKRKTTPFRRTGDKVKKVKKVDGRMKKLYKKRAHDYNSDDDDDDADGGVKDKSGPGPVSRAEKEIKKKKPRVWDEFIDEEKGMDGSDIGEENEVSGNEDDDELLPGITKFSEGCRAFKLAFKSVIKKSVPADSLGPVLSGQQKLLGEKLADEAAERKVKGGLKKEKHAIAEKGHVKLEKLVDLHDKFLIGVATKGVVKLFNAVNKAQNAQKGLNPSRFKDAKALKKHRKEAFFSELRKTSSNDPSKDGEGPAWAPLRDNYMLTNSKLKDWDKVQANAVSEETERMAEDSSSEENDDDDSYSD